MMAPDLRGFFLDMPGTVWKGYLSFGLVSFPIRLLAGARPQPVHFHMLHKKDLSRVREVFYCAAEDKPIERADIVKGYEYEKNRYVVVDTEELEKIAPPTATVMEILQFVRMNEIDPIFFETSYYVAPEESVSRPYSLLFEAMRETQYDALAKVTMHGREHIVVLRPSERGIVLHTMYFVDELQKKNQAKVPARSKRPDKKEMELARRLIETLAGPFEPQKYHDEYKENVEKLIGSKRNGKKILSVEQPRKAPVIDLMQALQRSLAGGSRRAPRSHSGRAKNPHRKQSARVA
jgi:DNA end-binding protein Ku